MHTFRFQLVKRLVASKNFMEYNPITVYIAFLSFCGLSAFVIPCLQQFRGSPEEIFGKKMLSLIRKRSTSPFMKDSVIRTNLK